MMQQKLTGQTPCRGTKKNALLSLLVLFALCCSPIALGEVERDVELRYSEEDAARYAALFERAKEFMHDTVPGFEYEPFAVYREKHYFNNLVLQGGIPTELDMTEEEALFTAYSCIEEKYDETEEVLIRFYPTHSFNVEDPANPIWIIHLSPFINGEFEIYGSYIVHIEARTGVVVHIVSDEDALG